MTSSRNCSIYNRVITKNEVIFRYIDMSIQDIIYHDHVVINPAEFEILVLDIRVFVCNNDWYRIDNGNRPGA